MKSIKSKALQATLGAVALVVGTLVTAGTAQGAFVDLSQSTVNGNDVTVLSNLADPGKLYFDIDHNNFSTVNLVVQVTAGEVTGGTLDLGSTLRNLTSGPWPGYQLALGGPVFFSDVSGTLDPMGDVTLSSGDRIATIAWDPAISNAGGDNEVYLGEVDESFGDLPWVIDISGINTSELTFTLDMTPVPVPAAVWLFGSALLGLVGVARRREGA